MRRRRRCWGEDAVLPGGLGGSGGPRSGGVIAACYGYPFCLGDGSGFHALKLHLKDRPELRLTARRAYWVEAGAEGK